MLSLGAPNPKVRNGRWNRNAYQNGASTESRVFDAGDGRWNRKASQRGASIESTVSDGGVRKIGFNSSYNIDFAMRANVDTVSRVLPIIGFYR